MKRLLILSLIACTAGQGLAAAVGDDYMRPRFAMPYAWRKPQLDGVVDATESRQALGIRALQTTQRALSSRQAKFYLCCSDVFGDSYEIWLDVVSLTDGGQPCFVQFLANYAGARDDVLHLPAVGNSRIGWWSGREPMNRITEDNVWEWEVAIPRTSVSRTKRPWEQTSVEGASSFAILDTHSLYVLSKTAPALQLEQAADLQAKALGFALAGWSRSDGEQAWHFDRDSGVSKEGKLLLNGGQPGVAPPALNLDQAGDGGFRISVVADSSATLRPQIDPKQE